MAEDKLTTLYNLSEVMTAAGDQVKEKHEDDYKKMIDCLKTSKDNKERILAAQLIARFFKYFPELEDVAFDPLVDLCESTEVSVRKHATMAMVSICRGSKQVVSKAADILIQLYQTDQPSEVKLINQSLATLFDLNIEQFLKSFFANFGDGNELVRERALKFLSSKITALSDLPKEIEQLLMERAKSALQDVTKEEFIAFINILSKLKISKTTAGQATLVSAIMAQAELDKPFDPSDKDRLDKLMLCTKSTIPFLSLYNRAPEYINYICLNILPHLGEISGHELDVLGTLAETSAHIIADDIPSRIDLDQCHKAVHLKLIEYLPLPAETSSDASQEVDLQFTHIEYLMYTFLQLCRHKPELWTESLQSESRKHLSHLANCCKKYIDALERQRQLNKDDLKLKQEALRTTKNISGMILDLFRNNLTKKREPPSSSREALSKKLRRD